MSLIQCTMPGCQTTAGCVCGNVGVIAINMMAGGAKIAKPTTELRWHNGVLEQGFAVQDDPQSWWRIEWRPVPSVADEPDSAPTRGCG